MSQAVHNSFLDAVNFSLDNALLNFGDAEQLGEIKIRYDRLLALLLASKSKEVKQSTEKRLRELRGEGLKILEMYRWKDDGR